MILLDLTLVLIFRLFKLVHCDDQLFSHQIRGHNETNWSEDVLVQVESSDTGNYSHNYWTLQKYAQTDYDKGILKTHKGIPSEISELINPLSYQSRDDISDYLSEQVYHTYYDSETGEVIRHTCVEDPGTQFIFWYNIIGVSCFYGIVLLTIGLLYRQVPSVIIIIVLSTFNKSTSIAPDEGLGLTFCHIFLCFRSRYI